MIRLIAFLMVVFCAGTSFAQGEDDNGWEFKVTPYLFTAALDGKVGIGPITTGIDASFGDVLDHLDMAFMMFATARKNRWIVGFDAMYFKVSGLGNKTLDGPFGHISIDGAAELAAPQQIYQPTLGYRVFAGDGPTLDAYAAARYTSVENEITLTTKSTLPSFPGGERTLDGDATWWDPVFGMRVTAPMTDHLFATALVDFGGFGAGSDVTYQWLGALGWQFNGTIAAHAGYRYFKQDYEEDGIVWDMAMEGVLLGVGFTF